MTKLSEKLLLLKLKSKDPEVFGQFYDLYAERIHRFIYFKVSSREEAEDLTAETFLKIWEHIFGNKKIDHLNAFTYQVARNLVIDWYRKRAQAKVVTAPEEELVNIPDTRQSVDEKLSIDLDVAAMEKYLRQLKDEYQEVIILRYIDELSVGEIAKILGKSSGAVRVLSHRALTAIKELIKKDE